jgi:beta-glucanase (GH16 family)
MTAACATDQRIWRRIGLVALAVTMLTLVAGCEAATRYSVIAAPRPPDCGAWVAKSTGGFWKCTFVDNFSGTTLDPTKWSPMVTSGTGVVSPECRVAGDNNIKVQSGFLRLTVRRETAPFSCKTPGGSYSTQYTGGAVTTYNKFSQAYGRFEIRARFPDAKVRGLHSAVWMWPQTMKYGGASGELDIAEFRTVIPDRVIPYVHYNGADRSATNNFCMVSRPEAFHSYVMEWTVDTITVKYDGQACLVHSWQPSAPLLTPQPFDQPFAMILNQGLGHDANSVDTGLTTLPASMYVDYVRVWS